MKSPIVVPVEKLLFETIFQAKWKCALMPTQYIVAYFRGTFCCTIIYSHSIYCLFYRCILSFPYVDNVPESLKTEIFGSVAVLNEKLDEIQRHFSEHNLNLVRSENKEFCTWKSNWVSLAQTWFDRKLEIGEISQKCFSILIETDQSLHYFDTDIVLKIKLVHSDGGCTIETERVVNIEIEQIRDYLNTEKVFCSLIIDFTQMVLPRDVFPFLQARFDQMRDLFLSKYHDVVIIRGSMRNVNVDIHDIENDLVFTAAKEALHDIVQ